MERHQNPFFPQNLLDPQSPDSGCASAKETLQTVRGELAHPQPDFSPICFQIFLGSDCPYNIRLGARMPGDLAHAGQEQPPGDRFSV